MVEPVTLATARGRSTRYHGSMESDQPASDLAAASIRLQEEGSALRARLNGLVAESVQLRKQAARLRRLVGGLRSRAIIDSRGSD